MKIAVCNFTGTVGKTTVVSHVLAPRMPQARVLAVETINQTASDFGLEVDKIGAENFRSIFQSLIELDDAIIDVGASNVEGFLAGLARFAGIGDEIDIFIVPATPGNKQQKETISFVKTLAGIGIAREKIRIVFNRVATDAEEEFPYIFNFARKETMCVADPEAVIAENEIFDLLGARGLTIAAALDDPTDYKAALRELGANGDPKLRARYGDMCAIVALAKVVNRNLDTLFDVLIA